MCLLFVMFFLLLPSLNKNLVTASTSMINSQEIESFMDTVIGEQMEEFHIPNLTVSIVHKGDILFAKGYGFSDYESQQPVDPEKTLFRIGSAAKLFTWTAVMQLVEEGKLDLDTDVNEYLDFTIPDRLAFEPKTSKAAPITVRHLMSHTAGFEDYMSNVFSITEDSLTPLSQSVREELPARVFAPGEVISYSNYGTSLAGYIVEVVSGVPFAQYIEDNIYAPLQMENSSFRQPLPNELAKNMSKAYRNVNGEFLEGKFEFFTEPSGSMSSTAVDMAAFMLAYLQGGQLEGGRILKEETVYTMWSDPYTLHPSIGGMAHGFIKGPLTGRDIFYHPGGTMLYDTGFYLLPEEDLGFFISHSGGSFLANQEIFYSFLDRYFPMEETPDALEPAAGVVERSQEFAGEYYNNRRSFTTTDAFLSLMFGQIYVEADEAGYLLITHLGEKNRFAEIEPGVYLNLREGRSQDYGGDFSTIVFGTDTLGKTMLMTDGPMSYSKAGWYESFGFTLMLLISSVLFLVGSLFYWGIKALVAKLRRKHPEIIEKQKIAGWAKRTAVFQGSLTLIFLVTFISAGEPDPLYGLPKEAYLPPSLWSQVIDLIVSYGIVLLTFGVVAFSVIAWKNGHWKLAGRIHYSFFALFSVFLSWIFYFWNVI